MDIATFMSVPFIFDGCLCDIVVLVERRACF